MRKLIRRILIKLRLVKPKIGWEWYGGYGRVKSNDWIIFGEIVEDE